MFVATYKNTCKILLRSYSFWLCFVIVAIVATYSVYKGTYGYYAPGINEIIYDTDPRFVLDYQTYIKHFTNTLNDLFAYSVPIFAVVSSTLIINRDYSDGFYEIEKPSGIMPSRYLFGRIFAVITVTYILATLLYTYSFYLFTFTRGGVAELNSIEILNDSLPRIARLMFLRGLPNILFFISLTFFLGNVFKNGIIASIGAISYAVFCYISEFFLAATLKQADATFFFDWFHPLPKKASYYFYYYETEWFEDMIKKQNVSADKAALCIMFLIGVSLLFSIIAFIQARKRTV